jgi:acyl-CoA thioesterase-1
MFKIYFAILITLFSTTLAAKSILVLGDSLSASYRMDTQDGWVNLVQQKINQKESAHTIFNESIPGDTTAGGLARVDKALIQHKPVLVLLELGANDGLRGLSPQRMKNNLKQMISRSQKSGAKVLLLAMQIPPNYGKRYTTMFDAVYPKLAKEMDIPIVPFMLKDIALNKELMQKDRLHPNEKAQPLIADKVWQYLEPMIEE